MATFNPPYNLDYAFDPNQPMESQTPKEVYTDKDGNQVTRQEIDDYAVWLEANPPVIDQADINALLNAKQ